MKEIQTQNIANYFDVTLELLPYLPELLSDLWVLGSSPELIIEWLRPLDLPAESTRVLDLGCGKGAVSIPLAQELGFRIFGVDFFEPFVVEARTRAEALGVTDLCQFEHENMVATLRHARDFDIVVYTAVGGVLGSFEQCVGHLRQCVHAGGYIVIDDGFLAAMSDSDIDFPGYEHYAPHEETIQQLTAYGDKLLQEKVFPPEEIRKINQQNTKFITTRATNLAQRHPELADSFFWLVEQEKRESEILETKINGAVWLLQKA